MKKFIDDGGDRAAVCADLESLRIGASDAEENVILNVLDFLSGWCSPQMKIWSTSDAKARQEAPPWHSAVQSASGRGNSRRAFVDGRLDAPDVAAAGA